MFDALAFCGIACFATYFYLRLRHDNMTRLKALVWVFGLFFCLGCFAWMASGCASLDQVAEATKHATTNPAIQAGAGAIDVAVGGPWATLLVGVAGAAATLYQSIRSRSWKTTFQTVVRTVEPFIPADEVQRDALAAAQGPKVTALVKAVKTSG